MDPEEETKDEEGLTTGSTYLEGLVVPAHRKFTINGNRPPNNIIAYAESPGARRRERSTAAKFLPTNEEIDEKSLSMMCDGGGAMIFQRKVEYWSRLRVVCHRSSKPAADDERAGDGIVEESS